MADYHVKACDNGIIAGILRKDGEFGDRCSAVTDEAIVAVRNWLLYTMQDGQTEHTLRWNGNDGVIVNLSVTIEYGEPEEPEYKTYNEEDSANG